MLEKKDFSQSLKALLSRGKKTLESRKRESLVHMAINSDRIELRDFDISVYAMNSLIQLKDPKSVKPLLLGMDEISSNNDEYCEFIIEFLQELDMIAFDNLVDYLFESSSKKTIFPLEAMGKMGKTKEDKDKIAETLMKFIDLDKDSLLNAFAIMSLVECSKDKYITFIREAFKTKEIDFSIMGDIGDIEIKLGLKKDKTNRITVEKLEKFQKKYNLTKEETINQMLRNNDMLYDKMVDIGKNDPCPCGSGKKYKKCCLNKN